MSIEGKKKAQKLTTFKLAIQAIKVHYEALKIGGLAGAAMTVAHRHQCIAIMRRLNETPHQYFNSEGKIDKRKKRKHERKMGYKLHTQRIIRINHNGTKDGSLIGKLASLGLQ